MLVVASVVQVEKEKCIGCKACDRVCPTEAIVTRDRLARVDEASCTGCNKCIEACMDHQAIHRKRLDTPRLLGVDIESVHRGDIEALCEKARLNPRHPVCPCTLTLAVKAIVVNYMWKQAYTVPGVPTISAQPSVTRLFKRRAMGTFHEADNLTQAMEKAYEIAGTRKVIVFDGTYGAINCSPELAKQLLELAPRVSQEVEEHFLPKWLRQRGLDLDPGPP